MKFIIVMLCAVFCYTAHSNPVRVKSIGKTFEEAKQNGFKSAVAFVSGSVLLSDRESKNSQLTRNEISVYSSGYIDNFKIVSQTIENNFFVLVMDVQISESKIAQRLFSNSTSIQQFESARHSEQIKSILVEKQNGDKLIKQVLSDYPHKAFTLIQHSYKLGLDQNRNLQLFVPYSLQWNNNFLLALHELFNIIDEGGTDLSNRYLGNLNLVSENNFAEQKSVFRLNDTIRVNGIRNFFQYENEVRLLLLIKDANNRVMLSKCYIPDSVVGKHKPLYSLGQPNALTIWQSTIENNHVQVNLPNTLDVAKITFYITEIELRITNDKECSKIK